MQKFYLFFLFVTAATLTGCNQQNASQNQVFAGKAIELTNELEGAGAKWGKVLGPWLEGGTLDTQLAVRETQSLKDFVSQLKTKFEKLPVPDNQECQSFAMTIKGYLDFEAEMAVTFDEMIQTAADNNPASLEVREQWLEQLMALNDEELVWKSSLIKNAKALGLRIIDASDAN